MYFIIHTEDKATKAKVGKHVVYNVEWLKKHFDTERKLYEKKGNVIHKHRHYHNVKHYTGEDEKDGEIRTINVLEDYEWNDPYCEKCGRRIEDAQSLYCAYCGVKLNWRTNKI